MGSLVSRALNVASTSLHDNLSQPVDLGDARCPKRNPALIRHMTGRLCNAEEFGDAIFTGALKLNPTLNLGVALETQRGQQSFVK